MIKIPNKELSELNIGGLHGRILKLEACDDQDLDILVVYGIHSSLERMYTTAKFHSRYGRVWMPDLPGFGGMDSFYEINRLPDLDSYADYLYTCLKTYKLDEKRIRIVAMSFGFLVVTRMLQKYPKMSRNIEFVISFVGFGRTEDFSIKTFSRPLVKLSILIGSSKLGSMFVEKLIFNKLSLRLMFAVFRILNPNPKYRHESKSKQKEAVEMELELWSSNDARTKFYTYKVLSDLDLTKSGKPIDLNLYDMVTPADQYFDSESVSSTLGKLYKQSSTFQASLDVHAPSVIGSEEDVAKIYPDSIKKILAK